MRISSLVAIATLAVCSAHAAAVEPLALATSLSLRIEGDEDVADQQRMMIALRLIDRGQVAAGLTLAESIHDYRAGVVMAACLQAAPDRAKVLLPLIDKLASVANPRGADELHLQVASHLATLTDHENTVAESLGKIRDEESKLAAELMVAAQRPGFDLKPYESRLEKFTSKVPFPGAVDAAHLLAQSGIKHWAEDEKSARGMLEQALVLAKRGNVPHADFLLDTALALAGLKAEDLLNTFMAAADQELASVANAYEFKIPLMVKRARLHYALKESAKGEAILKQATALAQQMDEWSRPTALVWSSIAECHFCNTEGGRHRLDDALHIAGQNPNPRMQLLTGIQACFAHDDLSTPVAEALAAKIQALGAAPVSPLSAP